MWPFDGPPEDSGEAPVVVEIYAQVFNPGVAKSRQRARQEFLGDLREQGEQEGWLSVENETLAVATASADAFDALVSAIVMCRRLTAPRVAFGRYRLGFYNDPLVAVEGRIWDVRYHTLAVSLWQQAGLPSLRFADPVTN